MTNYSNDDLVQDIVKQVLDRLDDKPQVTVSWKEILNGESKEAKRFLSKIEIDFEANQKLWLQEEKEKAKELKKTKLAAKKLKQLADQIQEQNNQIKLEVETETELETQPQIEPIPEQTTQPNTEEDDRTNKFVFGTFSWVRRQAEIEQSSPKLIKWRYEIDSY